MHITMIKKRLADGSECCKCREATEHLQSRGLWSCRNWAASSLPVPDSPSISTVASVGDAISSTANSSRIATLLPAIAPK